LMLTPLTTHPVVDSGEAMRESCRKGCEGANLWL
jgi:hypothetical protein